MNHNTDTSDVSIGLDLCDERIQAVVLDVGAEEIEERRIASTREAFDWAVKECAGCVMVMEMGTRSPWVIRSLRSRGFRVIVARLGYGLLSEAGTDRVD